MSFLKNITENSIIYDKINSKEYKIDQNILEIKDFYRKYYWFLPTELIENIDKINEKYMEIKKLNN